MQALGIHSNHTVSVPDKIGHFHIVGRSSADLYRRLQERKGQPGRAIHLPVIKEHSSAEVVPLQAREHFQTLLTGKGASRRDALLQVSMLKVANTAMNHLEAVG